MLTSKSSASDNVDIKTESLKTVKMQRRLFTGLFILVLAALLYLLGQILNILSIPVGILIWTAVLVFCLKGPVNFLEKKGVSRFWGTCIAYVIMVVVVGLIAALLFSPVFGFNDQVAHLAQSLPGYITAIQDWFNKIYEQYAHLLQDDQINQWVNSAFSSLGDWFSKLAQNSAENIVVFGAGFASTCLVIGFALVVSFWTLMELPAIGREVKRVLGPKHEEDLDMIYFTITRVMGGYIKGTLIQCFLIGLFCGVGFAVMGIPSAAALGVIAGLLNIIPVVGPWFGGILAGIVGVFVSPWVAFLAVVYTIIVQQVVYTFVSPKVMGDAVDIHPALVILALMAGSALGYAMSGFMGSFVGALASIPVVAAMKSFFVYYYEKRTGRVIVSPDGVIFKGGQVTSQANPVQDATGATEDQIALHDSEDSSQDAN